GIISDGAAIDYLKRNIDSYLVELGVNIDNAKLADVKSDITKYYNENKKRKLSMNIGEYTDIIGNDPYSGHMKFVYDEIIDKHKNVHLAIWTKSANFDEVLKHDGHGRIKFTFGLNTPTIIDKYEHGTASLEDRLNGIKKIQGRGGYDIRLCIEPIINYDGCESEYVELVDKVMKSIDPSNVSKIILGSTRFRKDMVRNIRKNHPWTTLFNNMEEFEEYDPNDKRLRYSEEFRIKIYKKLIDAIRKHTRAKITLGAEIPEMWDWVGLDRKKFMKDKVYQYPG
uniref:spore photoproduct lyase family protein n=1 Tax=Endozoicomonas sp. ONNA1 TaxID=2828740 RepID=UPI0021491FC1